MVTELNARAFEKKVLQSAEPVLVEIWAPWCGPCRAMQPTLEAVSRQFSGRAQVVKINADKNAELVRRYKVLGIPTLLYFRHGRLVDKQTGMQSEAAIAKRLTPLLTLSTEAAAKREITGLFRRPSKAKIITFGLGTLAVAAGVIWWLV